LLAGRYQDAAERVCAVAAADEPGYRELRWIDPFVGAAAIEVDHGAGPTEGYRRVTDPATGVVTQHWRRSEGGEVLVRAFVSRPHDVVVIRVQGRLRGRDRGGVRLRPLDDSPPVPISFTTDATPEGLTLRARLTRRWPRALPGYAVACRIVVDEPESLVLYARTGVGEVDPAALLADLAALPADPDEVLDWHAATHGALFGRTQLDLHGGTDRELCTEDLLAGPAGPALVERLFDAGRYAIISSCGERPPTLQGVWSGGYHPAWASGHTLDGNLQAAVAALLPTRVPELMLGLFDMLDEFAEDFRHNARRLYGCDGLLTPVHVSSHGRQNHFGPVWCQTFWTAGAAWLARHYWDYWRHTGDREFLRARALPFMAEAARFYLDFVVWRDGTVTFAPSYSPENAPGVTGTRAGDPRPASQAGDPRPASQAGDPRPASQAGLDATMDVAAVGDLLRNLVRAAEELGVDHPDRPGWARLLAALPPFRVNGDGELAEWIHPDLADQHAHRHASHLYPLWYELDPAFVASTELRSAAERAIEERLAFWRGATGPAGEAAGEMAYGLVQLGLAAAQLGLAGPAHEAVRMLCRYWRPSLVATHNLGHIFNVDICGGLPALVLAMLVRSGEARIDLLPALPDAWPRGEVRGVGCRDRLTVHRLTWTPERVEAEVSSAVDATVTVGLPDGERRLTLRAGAPVTLSGGR
jgi:hypothetical protein